MHNTYFCVKCLLPRYPKMYSYSKTKSQIYQFLNSLLYMIQEGFCCSLNRVLCSIKQGSSIIFATGGRVEVINIFLYKENSASQRKI